MGFDPDITRRDDAPYWAAVLAMAVRTGNLERQREAQANLRRLGIPLTVGSRRKAVARGR
jgi:hypothetical protein